jgi:hypothetical protein
MNTASYEDGYNAGQKDIAERPELFNALDRVETFGSDYEMGYADGAEQALYMREEDRLQELEGLRTAYNKEIEIELSR